MSESARSEPPPRVLMVARALVAQVAGGLEHHVETLARGLAARGCAVDVLTTRGAGERLAGSEVRVLDRVAAPAARYSLAYFVRAGREIERLRATGDYDVVHAHEFALGFARIPRGPGVPRVVLSVHGTIDSETPLHRDVFPTLTPLAKLRAIARFGRRRPFAPVWKRSLARADAILVDSEFTRGELARMDATLGPKVRTVPLCTDADPPESGDRDEARGRLAAARASLGDRAPLLLTLGRVEWQKGHEVALRALARIRDLPWRYVVAGEGTELARLSRSARAKGIDDRVEFLGRVDAATKRDLLAAADLFLWPERTHPAFGLVGLEAMLAGVPVVATRRGAIPEVLGEDGRLFDSEDDAALAAILREAIERPETLGAMRAGLAERAAARFDRGRMIGGVLEAYRGVGGG